jgi:hypothetical protein
MDKPLIYKDNRGLSRALVGALVGDGLMGAACAVGCALLARGLQGRPVGEALEVALAADPWLGTLDGALDVGTLAGQALRVVVMVMWCVWIYRAAANLRAFGAQGLRHTPAWAVIWYFVPLANLVKPYQVMGELWRHSQAQWTGRAPALLPWWWGLWIVAQVVAHVASRASWEASTAVESGGAHVLLAVSFGLDLPVALLAAAVVLAVTRLQAAHPAANAPQEAP